MDSNNQPARPQARFPKFPLFIAGALLLLFLVRSLHTQQAEERSGWNDSQKQVLAKAKEEGKRVLMDFTGSDWCAGCIKLDREVFSTPEFKDYAAKNLVLWELDFPRQKYIDPSLLQQNEELRERYRVEAYPALIVLDSNGKVVGTLDYTEGGPKAFITALEKLPKA